MNTQSTVAAPATLNGSRIVPAIAAFVLGLALLATAGFAAPSAIHNATHDTRHALGLPCH